MGEKKERSIWQKFVRGFWIVVGSIVTVIILGFFIMFSSSPTDDKDLTDNQQYVVYVSHGTNNYIYYCSGYTRNLVNRSFILIDYEGKPSAEIVITSTTGFRVQLNPDYKKEYFEKKESPEVPSIKKEGIKGKTSGKQV